MTTTHGWALCRTAWGIRLRLVLIALALLIAGSSTGSPARAAEAVPQDEAAEEGEPDWTRGPARVDLGSESEVDVTEGFAFIDGKTTRAVLEKMGNPTDGGEVGMIVPTNDAESWFLIFEYRDVGYVDDSDGAEIDAPALLESITEGTEEANKVRLEKGFDAVHVVGWHEPPHYDASTHNLVWAIEGRDDAGHRSVNYNVRLLGRNGYTSVTLVADPEELAAAKPGVGRLLTTFNYKSGSRYAEYLKGDKLAGYGLTALVAGGAGAAAAKLGLFGKLGVLFAKGGKVLVAVGAALVAGLARLLRRRPKTDVM